jgi:hypothetical protein
VAIRINASGEGIKFLTEPAHPFTVTFNFKLRADKNTWTALWSWESGDPGSDTSAQLIVTTDTSGVDLQGYDGASMNALGVTATVDVWGKCAISVANTPNTMIVYVANTLAGALDVNNLGTISPTSLDRFLFGANSFAAEYLDGLIDNIKIFDSVLTQAEIEAELETRDQVLTPYIHLPMIGADVTAQLADTSGNGRNGTALGTLSIEDGAPIEGGSSGAMSGAIAAAGAVSGTLAGAGALSGAVAAVGAVAGTLVGSGAMSATIACTGGVAGVLTGNSPMSATIACAASVAATLLGSGALSGAVAATGSVAGTMAGAGALSGAIAATGSVTGTLANLSGHDLVFDGAVLEYQGAPMPRLGRTAWALVTLNVTDRNIFLTDCEDKDYTVIEFGAIWRDERTDGVPFCNAGATLPFTNTLDASAWDGSLTYGDINDDAPDFETPNTTYWNFVKAIVDECESRGIMVMLFPSYVGFPGTGQGWGEEMVANGATKIEAFGAYVGGVFAGNGNIIWMLAGDQGTGGEPFDATELAIQQALHDGIESANGNSTLFSAEFRRNSTTKDVAGLASRITANMSYANSDNINVYTREAYDEVAYQVALQEGPFDEEGADGNSVNTDSTQPCRRYDYWSWLSGIGGYTSGNGYVWPFNDTGSADDWDNHLDTQTAQDEARLNALIKSLIWWTLIPSGIDGMRNLITAGQGTIDDQDWIAAAANGDSGTASLLLAYCPPGADGTFSVDLRVMSGTCRLRWFDPTDGTYTLEAEDVANTEASFAVSTPGANDEGTYDDWLLVVDLGGELSASIAATGTVVGILRGTGDLSGTIAGAATVAGTLAAAGALVGTIPATATVTGAMVGAGAMAGTIAGHGTITGRLRDVNDTGDGPPPFAAPGPLQPTFRVLGS